MTRLRLGEFCQARSGDKADVANIAVFAPNPEAYELLRDELTPGRVAEHLAALVAGPVVRYEAPNVLALNFVCQRALGGGGPRTLRSDLLGKTLGPNLLRMEVPVPDELAERLPRLRPPTHTALAGRPSATGRFSSSSCRAAPNGSPRRPGRRGPAGPPRRNA